MNSDDLRSLFQIRRTGCKLPGLSERSDTENCEERVSGAAAKVLSSMVAASMPFQSVEEAFWKGWRKARWSAIEQQLKSIFACILHSGWDEGWGALRCFFSRGQQLWREGEGSGLGAGEDPAGATTAARDRRPEHAMTRWLTDQASSATIRTTPVDRLLAIATRSLRRAPVFRSDWHHMGAKYSYELCRGVFAATGGGQF